jgi:hypothetical protein
MIWGLIFMQVGSPGITQAHGNARRRGFAEKPHDSQNRLRARLAEKALESDCSAHHIFLAPAHPQETRPPHKTRIEVVGSQFDAVPCAKA